MKAAIVLCGVLGALAVPAASAADAATAVPSDSFDRPGVRALRAAEGPRVELAAKATDIAANAIVEFLVIAEGSAHDYEALFVSKASAKDLDAALRFVGMRPGRAAYAQPLSFWPRGERVTASLRRPDGTLAPLESLVLDRREGRGADATLPVAGFVYAGSRPAMPDPGRAEPDALAADYDGPCSILSLYNEPTTLLDVPRKAVQDEVYERFLARPAEGVAPGDEVTIVLAPEPRAPAEGVRARDYALAIRGAADGAPSLRLSDAAGAPVAEGGPEAVAAAVRALVARRIDPYATLDWGDDTPFGTAAAVAAWLDALDGEDGLRVEAPREGQPYYRAFLPDPAWRERQNRPSQPLELRLSRDGSAVRATLVSIREMWPADGSSLEPSLEPSEIPVPSPGEAAALADATGNEIPALLVFADPATTLGEALPYVRALQAKRPNVYFFSGDAHGSL